MLAAEVLPIEALPQKKATQVKNKWADLVREVRKSGTVAVTNHDRVEMVVMDVAAYQSLSALARSEEERRAASLKELTAEFDRRLAALQQPDAAARVDAMMDSNGRNRKRPIAGKSY